MAVENGNALQGNWKKYLPRLIKQWSGDIPEERRESLLEEIKAKANLFGCKDECALKAALMHLKK